MNATLKPAGAALKLDNLTAADLMAPNPISIAATANVQEALMLLTDKNFSAAPVIDEGGRPVGVISRSDLLVHDREQGHKVGLSPDYYLDNDVAVGVREIPEGFQIENVDRTTVDDIMTPAVFSVRPDTPVSKVVAEMIGLHVHRLFVTDDDGTLIGVISTMDLLKRLRPIK
jgi:CBS domain-containing protein